MWAALAVMTLAQVDLADGTLLFVENSHNLVECYTHSTYSHVAIVLDGNVYEADLPKIRKYTVAEWFTNVGKYNEGKGSPALVTVMAPDTPYVEAEIVKMREFLDAQIDRRYSIQSYLKKSPRDGIHCSEMCAGALEATGKFNFEPENYKLSPGDLHDVVTDHHQVGNKLYVRLRDEYRRPTTIRWKDWWKRKGSFCSWSCWETVTFWR